MGSGGGGTQPPRAATAEGRCAFGPDLPGGQEIVVSNRLYEPRIALVSGNRVVQAWRIRGAGGTSISTTALAEPYGNGLLVVVRVTSYRLPGGSPVDFLQVVRLTPNGITPLFSIKAHTWAPYITGPASFRLHSNSLYELEPRQSVVQIVRFDLGPT